VDTLHRGACVDDLMGSGVEGMRRRYAFLHSGSSVIHKREKITSSLNLRASISIPTTWRRDFVPIL